MEKMKFGYARVSTDAQSLDIWKKAEFGILALNALTAALMCHINKQDIKAVSDLKQQLAAVQEKKDKLLGLYLESTFTKEQLDSRLEPLTAEEKELGLKIKALSKTNDEIKADIQEVEETISYLQTIKEKTDRELKAMQFTATKEEILADIDHITVMPDGQLSVRYKAFEEIERLLEKHKHFIPAERFEEIKKARRVS